ncbi:hypothetical protein RTM1035_14887 [Roseovarius sp. TM1035]|jgi:hypothetical protein|uniref:hypothetical protein n=1 Tax=Roseovarius sp. TM1035 TaxID=391613 RepID=UPI000155683C|nr:hypothetical protein [Roseovarius sp. TM1035]EDM33280.1 hypothetical protein RTM1035_14887 [Roseovarius sp. TM1035]
MTDPFTSDRVSAPAADVPEIIIHKDQAAKYQAAVELKQKNDVERKYNIKLLRQDYDVIKMAADANGRSASYFVSFLIYDHIARELADMEEDNKDALLLMAATADVATDYDIMSTPWLYDIMSEYLDVIVAAMTGTDGADLAKLMKMIEKYQRENSHLHAVVKLMMES